MEIYCVEDYILQDQKTGQYVSLDDYTSNPDEARVFSGAWLKDHEFVLHRPWQRDFKAIKI
jgi:hypothetical protein